jgi:phage FluMu protein Com
MLCPKCGYNSFDSNIECPKCKTNLTRIKNQLYLKEPPSREINFFDSVESESTGPNLVKEPNTFEP